MSRDEPKSPEAAALERIAEDTAILRRFAIIDALAPVGAMVIIYLVLRFYFFR